MHLLGPQVCAVTCDRPKTTFSSSALSIWKLYSRAVMNGALHTHGGRALFEGDSIKSAAGSILSDVANAATTNPATVFSSFLKGIVSEAQDFSSFNKSQLANLSESDALHPRCSSSPDSRLAGVWSAATLRQAGSEALHFS